MAFSLSLIHRDDTGVHVAAEGEATIVDFRAVPSGHHFEALLGHEWNRHNVLLNMEQVPYIDSSAIGWLISVQRSFRAAQGRLVLHSVQPAVRNVLEMLKINRLIPVAADAAAGRALFQNPAAAAI